MKGKAEFDGNKSVLFS